MNNAELNKDIIDILEKINLCCIKIIEKNNLVNCKLKKLDCLNNNNFYDNYSDELFEKDISFPIPSPTQAILPSSPISPILSPPPPPSSPILFEI